MEETPSHGSSYKRAVIRPFKHPSGLMRAYIINIEVKITVIAQIIPQLISPSTKDSGKVSPSNMQLPPPVSPPGKNGQGKTIEMAQGQGVKESRILEFVPSPISSQKVSGIQGGVSMTTVLCPQKHRPNRIEEERQEAIHF